MTTEHPPPQQYAADAEPVEPQLDEVRQRHPGWVIEAIFGGYLAYPVGVTVVRMMFVDGLDERLNALDTTPQ